MIDRHQLGAPIKKPPVARQSAARFDASRPAHAPPQLQRAIAAPGLASPDQMLALQRSHGNRFVQRLVAQSKQTNSPPATGPQGGQLDHELQGQIQRARGGGTPLAPQVSRSIGAALDSNFDKVRIHTDQRADRLSRSLNAAAFTVGSDIFFRKGTYSPGSSDGRRLLAHELTHVVQQSASSGKPNLQAKLRVGPVDDPYERQAEHVANGVGSHKSGNIAPKQTPTMIQRFVTVSAGKNPLGVKLRVSEDGKLATPDAPVFEGSKVLYAHSSTIAAARAKLAKVESPYTVEKDEGDSIRLAVPGSGGIFKKKQYQTLYRVVPRDTRKTDEGASGTALKTIEACSAHGLDFMGVGVNKAQQEISNRVAKIKAGNRDITNVGSMFAAGRNDYAARDLILMSIARLELRLGDEAPNPDLAKAKEIYKGLSEKKRNHYARLFGINQYAMPDVGEGIEGLRAAGQGKSGAFPMHFAPVIARSGQDYVTFENYARSATERGEGDTESASSQWFFRMYGPYKKGGLFQKDEDQSYFGQHAKEGSLGTRTELMGLYNRNVAKDDDQNPT